MIGSTTVAVSFLIEKGEGKEFVLPVFDKDGKKTAEILVSITIKNKRSANGSKKEERNIKKNTAVSKSVTKMPVFNSGSSSPSMVRSSNNKYEEIKVEEEVAIE